MTTQEYDITKKYWKIIKVNIEEIENIILKSNLTVNGYLNRKDLHKVKLVLSDIRKYFDELNDKSEYVDCGSAIEKVDSFECHLQSPNPKEWLYKLQSVIFRFPDEITGVKLIEN
jgi:hypothetical protein